jgi:hypothetical protein
MVVRNNSPSASARSQPHFACPDISRWNTIVEYEENMTNILAACWITCVLLNALTWLKGTRPYLRSRDQKLALNGLEDSCNAWRIAKAEGIIPASLKIELALGIIGLTTFIAFILTLI